ncbi:helix-turn-helix domain-containing protein [Proteus mirabilis]|uniref:helix-turn-helix domain-containing protein n=1 Tax=Proteus mirabilis TaxID=584 RepID=UPI003C711165
MSRIATDWAWSLDLKAPQKILILSLADRADEYHCCYPSIQRLVKDTGLDKKTIGKWINLMIEDGLISDTGERKGPTKRVRVLRLNIEFECTQKRVFECTQKRVFECTQKRVTESVTRNKQ